MTIKKLASACFALTFAAISNANAHNEALPDDHAPIGVMGDHVHNKGEFMTSYRYSNMKMDGNRTGTGKTSIDKVHDQFMVAPIDMTMQMHMFGLMYGATNDLTLNVMVPYVKKSMNHVNRAGVKFKTETEGLGDVKIGTTYRLFESEKDAVHHRTSDTLLLNLALSLPTGAIDERGDTPAGNNQKLPYPMQLGSGTFDPIVGLTYVNKNDKWSWGSQANMTLRFGKNDEGYRLGNEYKATSWIARNLNKNASVSFRVEGSAWEDIEGADQDLNVNMVATARPDLRGGERVDAIVGLNLYKSEGTLAKNRLAAEFGMPFYQRLDGPQLETDYKFTLGWQMAF